MRELVTCGGNRADAHCFLELGRTVPLVMVHEFGCGPALNSFRRHRLEWIPREASNKKVRATLLCERVVSKEFMCVRRYLIHYQ